MIKSLNNKGLTSLEGVELSDDIQILNLGYNLLRSVIDVRFPERLIGLRLEQNRLSSIENVEFPEGLRELYLSHNQLNSIINVQFPEGLWCLTLHHNRLDKLDNLYVSPSTIIISPKNNEIREAVRFTCTRAIFRTPSVNPLVLGAWWARVSYLTGGVTYLTLEEVLYKMNRN